MNSGMKEFSFMWWIENFSCCIIHSDQVLYGPKFTPEGLNGTSWALVLNLFRLRYGLGESICLKRSFHDAGPESFPLKLQISVMKVDGSTVFSKECEHTFRKGDERGFTPFLYKYLFFVRTNTDTLGVRCRMWMRGESVQMVRQCIARTRIGIEKISFLHRVENFSALKLGEKKILQVPSRSETGCVFTSTLSLRNASRNTEEVNVSISPSCTSYKLCTKTLSLIDASGNIIECVKNDNRFIIRPYSLTKQFILGEREEYLPNDELTLLCEYTLYTGVNHFVIEENVHDLPVAVFDKRYNVPHRRNDGEAAEKSASLPSAPEDTKLNHDDQRLTDVNLKEDTLSTSSNAASSNIHGIYNQVTNNDPHQNKYNAAEKLCTCSNVQDDFETHFNDQFLSDIVLKTETKSYPAHKNVLCARSSVFRAMLNNDMKEKNSDCIKVEDLEDETVQRLLLFLYSDSLEELQWESAVQLYYEADKYAIDKLKFLCSSFLVENLSTSTASELLLLADTHNDTELKQVVEDFILEHEREVFDSEEWENLSEKNPQLVIKTMKLKYKREKGGK